MKNLKINKLFLVVVTIVLSVIALAASYDKNNWQDKLALEVKKIDAEFGGDVGLYVKKLKNGGELNYTASQPWYLASTIKILVAASFLHEVENGQFSLNDEIVLKKSHFVDGSGEVIWKKPGAKLKMSYLLNKMLTQSDSTATDIFINKIGVDRFNRFVKRHLPDFGPITTILAVRHEAYAEAHPNAHRLTNLDFIAFKNVPASQRLSTFAKKIRVSPKNLQVKTIEQAFERYYKKGSNSGRLDQFGGFIERLLAGQVLNAANTELMLKTMQSAETGKARIEAGLPKGSMFAQKTGTQLGRMCNVGQITPPNGNATIVVACIQNFSDPKRGDAVFRKIGKALTQSGVWSP